MSSDILNQLSSPTSAAAALLVASLGAVFAFTQLGARTTEGAEGGQESTSSSGVVTESESKDSKAKTRRRKKGKESGVGSQGKEKDLKSQKTEPSTGTVVVPFPTVVPGDFEVKPAVSMGTGAVARSFDSFPVNKEEGNSVKRKKKQNKDKDKDKDKAKQEVGKDEGKKPIKGGSDSRGPRSGDTTDASVSAFTPASSSLGQEGSHNVRASVSLAPSSQLSSSRGLHPSPSFDTDSSWTHIHPRRGKLAESTDSMAPLTLVVSTDVTSSDVASTASDSPVTSMHGARGQGDQRTLAEKLVPKPRKTGVDDMLERPDVPTLARVMRVQPRPDERPVPGFSWEDYGDVVEDGRHVNDADEEDEGEWGVVMGRNRQRNSRTTSTSTPAPAPPAASSPETMTKKQRQNAKKKEVAKAAKAEVEAARQDGLAKHKRELERLRIIEQSRQGGGKGPSGGMQATVDANGKLVWE